MPGRRAHQIEMFGLGGGVVERFARFVQVFDFGNDAFACPAHRLSPWDQNRNVSASVRDIATEQGGK